MVLLCLGFVDHTVFYVALSAIILLLYVKLKLMMSLQLRATISIEALPETI